MTELEYLRELTCLQQRRIEQLEAEVAEHLQTEAEMKPVIPPIPLIPPPATVPSFPDPRTYPRWQY